MTDHSLSFNNSNNQSDYPFDHIRHIDEQGNEFWYARELMPLLGYNRWEYVPDVVERAEIACTNSGNPCEGHFSASMRKTNGRSKKDFILSRYACYLVAMNGDPRKSEIASAQSYFAVKAREAEVKVPEQNDRIKELELQLEIEKNRTRQIESNERLFDKSQFILTAHGAKMLALMMRQPDAVVEKVEYQDRSIIVDENLKPLATFDGVGITYLAKRFGFGKGTKANNQCRQWLKSIGIKEDEWKPEPTIHYTKKLPRELVQKADQEWANRNGDRQKLIGE